MKYVKILNSLIKSLIKSLAAKKQIKKGTSLIKAKF